MVAGLSTSMLKFAAGAVSATAAVRALSSSFRDLDKLAKTSRKLGLDPRELGGLQHAANLTGVGIETLNMALQRMARRMAEAAHGTGEAKAAIKDLGIDATNVFRLSPDKQFLIIAEALGNIQNEADQLRLAFKLFDSEGVAVLNMVREGAPAIRRMAAEWKAFNDQLTKDKIKQIEKANDAITRMNASLDASTNQLAVTFAPLVEWFGTNFAAGLGGITRFVKTWRTTIPRDVVGPIPADERRRRRGMQPVQAPDFSGRFSRIPRPDVDRDIDTIRTMARGVRADFQSLSQRLGITKGSGGGVGISNSVLAGLVGFGVAKGVQQVAGLQQAAPAPQQRGGGGLTPTLLKGTLAAELIGEGRASPLSKIANLSKEQLKEQEEHNRWLEQIFGKLEMPKEVSIR